ncbi:MAG: PAS domain-containing protein [Kiritimatiellae bacterium]|nr:PAS domain-containing protein [Kiritimatiellia bacterium]
MNNAKGTTMRIDLIPEISEVPVSERPRTAVFRAPAAAAAAPAPAAPGGGMRDGAQGGYGELFQNIYDAAIVTDLHGRIRDVNARATTTFGYTPAQFSHLLLSQVVTGADADLIRTLHENLQRQCFTLLQAVCTRADGSTFPAEVSVSPLRLSTPHLCFFVRDETVRRQTDEMLRTEHNALQNAFDAIVVIDLQTRIEYANPATARIWGLRAAGDLVGRPLGTLLLNHDDALAVVEALAGETSETTGVAIAKRADGEAFRAEIRASANRDSDGNVVGAVLSFSDLTERDRVQVAEHETETMREGLRRLHSLKDSFSYNAAELAAALSELGASPAADDAARARIQSAAGNVAAIQSLLADATEIVEGAMAGAAARQPPLHV